MFPCLGGGRQGQYLGLRMHIVVLDYFEMRVNIGGVVKFIEIL